MQPWKLNSNMMGLCVIFLGLPCKACNGWSCDKICRINKVRPETSQTCHIVNATDEELKLHSNFLSSASSNQKKSMSSTRISHVASYVLDIIQIPRHRQNTFAGIPTSGP